MTAVMNEGSALQYAHESLQRDKEIVKAAVMNEGTALKYAHEWIKRDRDVVKMAVEKDMDAFKYVDGRLKRDKGFILGMIRPEGDPVFLNFMDEGLKKDRMFMRDCLERNKNCKF